MARTQTAGKQTSRRSRRGFKPEPIRCYEWSGAGAGELDPGREAVAIGARFHGAWLTAYMIRRFGPPNHPSDDLKNLCSWAITTPIRGLAILVTPYLADLGDREGMCLHFGYRWSKGLERQVRRADPVIKGYLRLCERVWRWQRRKFVGMYVADGGNRKLVVTFRQSPHKNGTQRPDIGLYWARSYGENRKAFVTKKEFFRFWGVRDAIVQEYRKQHPRKPRKKPAIGRWPESMIVRRCNFALRAAIRSLLAPIRVRDVWFSATAGYLRDGCPKGQTAAAPFVDAGWACKVDK